MERKAKEGRAEWHESGGDVTRKFRELLEGEVERRARGMNMRMADSVASIDRGLRGREHQSIRHDDGKGRTGG